MLNSGINVLFEGITIQRLVEGLFVTVGIALLAIIMSLVVGTLLGVIQTSKSLMYLSLKES